MDVGIIASGPSATREDALRLYEFCDQTIAVNDSWRLCKEAHHLYATDYKWWKWAIADVMRDFDGELWTQEVQWQEQPEDWGIKRLQSVHHNGLCTEPGKIYTGMNSGYAAINLAYHLGAKRIFLIGYDMMMHGERRHWFDDRPEHLNLQSNYNSMINCFKTINPADYGLEIINCSRKTALGHFTRGNLDIITACRAA